MHSLSQMDNILDILGGTKFSSTYDFAMGIGRLVCMLSQISVCHKSGSAQIHHGAFWHVQVSAQFKRLVEIVLGGLIWNSCFVYIDDVVACSHKF